MSDRQTNRIGTPQAGDRGGFWGHVLVAICACALTVAIVGSTVFLAYRFYHQHQWQKRAEVFVDSLQHLSPEELAESAAEVKSHPKVARLILPEVLKSLRDSPLEQQQCSAILVLHAFLNHKRVERTLFRMRRDARETVAAAAVEALSDLKPEEHAAEVLGRCLDDVPTGSIVDAAVDEACAGLFRLGEIGSGEMQKRLPLLSVDRRLWLVGYVWETGGPSRRVWLEMLVQDEDERVRLAAAEALQSVSGSPETPA